MIIQFICKTEIDNSLKRYLHCAPDVIEIQKNNIESYN